MANKKLGRPQFVIDWEAVDQMCKLQCTGEEIAGVLGCDYDTLNAAIKREHDQTFSEYFEQKSKHGKMSLRRRQYEAAMLGNPTLLIWLGKQWLGQSDTAEAETKDIPPINIIVNESNDPAD